MLARVVSIVCMSEFIEMLDQGLDTQVPQKITDVRVNHWRYNATHFWCFTTHISGCHQCRMWKYSYQSFVCVATNMVTAPVLQKLASHRLIVKTDFHQPRCTAQFVGASQCVAQLVETEICIVLRNFPQE